VIQLNAIVDGKRATMLTSESIQNAERSCLDRFGKRFEGFEPIPIEVVARAKWAEYRAKEITRAELEDWLAEQDRQEAIVSLQRAIELEKGR
jgi:hypothetical protein